MAPSRRASRRNTIRSHLGRPTPPPRPPVSCSALSYYSTYGLDVVVTRGSNTYGPYQHPEKLIPLFITNALDDRPLPLYGDGRQERADWSSVSDHARAAPPMSCATVMLGPCTTSLGRAGTRTVRSYGSCSSISHALLARAVASRTRLLRHDRRYAMDGARLGVDPGWQNQVGFESGLISTVEWYRARSDWLASGALGRLGCLLRTPLRGHDWRAHRGLRLTGPSRSPARAVA